MKFWMVAGHMETSSLGLSRVKWSKTTALAVGVVVVVVVVVGDERRPRHMVFGWWFVW